MNNHNIKAIIFDLGNVLIDFDHKRAAAGIAKFTEKSGQEIYDLFFDSQSTCLFEEGRILPQEFFLKVREMLNLKIDYATFLTIWNEIFFFTEKNLKVYNLARCLKSNYKVALLSNINILHFEYIKRTFPIFDAFHNIITSFEVGFRKPHPLIYQEALKLLGAPPQNVFYTDDRIDLVESASLLGIRSFVFLGIEQLERNLLENSVVIN